MHFKPYSPVKNTQRWQGIWCNRLSRCIPSWHAAPIAQHKPTRSTQIEAIQNSSVTIWVNWDSILSNYYLPASRMPIVSLSGGFTDWMNSIGASSNILTVGPVDKLRPILHNSAHDWFWSLSPPFPRKGIQWRWGERWASWQRIGITIGIQCWSLRIRLRL